MQRNEEGIVNNVFSKTGDAALPDTYEAGFIPATSTPGSGVFPKRTDFNFLFKTLTALAVDMNSCGCLLPWDALVNYYQGARVVGTDNKAYIATANNGPATDNGANPAQTPVPAVWQLSPENSFGTMALQNANNVTITNGTFSSDVEGGMNLFGEVLTLRQGGGNAAVNFQNRDSTNYLGMGYFEGIAGERFIMGNYGGGGYALAIDINGNTIQFPQGATDSGLAPTAPAQLTNKQYVDGTLTPGTFNGQDALYVQLPGGLVMQTFYGAYGGGPSGEVATFPQPFPNQCMRVLANDTTGARTIGTSVSLSNPASEFLVFTLNDTVDANVMAIGY